MKQFISRLSSRKFIVALIAAFVAFGNSVWDWKMSQEQVWSVIMPLLAFLGIEGAGDWIKRYKE